MYTIFSNIPYLHTYRCIKYCLSQYIYREYDLIFFNTFNISQYFLFLNIFPNIIYFIFPYK